MTRTCCRVAAAPVGLFGEQKKIRSVRRICRVDTTADQLGTGVAECSRLSRGTPRQAGESQGRRHAGGVTVQTCDRSGKKLFSGPQRRYSIPSKPWVSSRYPPVWPMMMLESTYAGYDGSYKLTHRASRKRRQQRDRSLSNRGGRDSHGDDA